MQSPGASATYGAATFSCDGVGQRRVTIRIGEVDRRQVQLPGNRSVCGRKAHTGFKRRGRRAHASGSKPAVAAATRPDLPFITLGGDISKWDASNVT